MKTLGYSPFPGVGGVRVKLVDNWNAVLAAENRGAIRGLVLMSQNLRRIEKGQIKYRPYTKRNTKFFFDKSRRPAVSMPGQPPYARTHAFKNAFHYAVDTEALTGWVGPITFRYPPTEHVPNVLEFGGQSNGGSSKSLPWFYRGAPTSIDNEAALAEWAMQQGLAIRPKDSKGKTNKETYSAKTGQKERYFQFTPRGGMTLGIARRTASTLAHLFGLPSNYVFPETIKEHPYARPALVKARRDFPRYAAQAMQRAMRRH